MKTVTVAQFLTASEIDRAAMLYETLEGTGRFATTLEEEIILPNMDRINKSLGQVNHPRYLAYVVEFALSRKAPS